MILRIITFLAWLFTRFHKPELIQWAGYGGYYIRIAKIDSENINEDKW